MLVPRKATEPNSKAPAKRNTSIRMVSDAIPHSVPTQKLRRKAFLKGRPNAPKGSFSIRAITKAGRIAASTAPICVTMPHQIGPPCCGCAKCINRPSNPRQIPNMAR